MKHPAQKKYLLKIALPAVLISFLLVAVTQVAFAQQENQQSIRNITVSPPTIEHTLNPGESAEGILRITNGGNTDLTFNANTHDFVVEDKSGTPDILSEDTLSEKYSGASWLAVTPQTFTVEAGTTREINYFLQVPADAAAGGRYAATIYEPVNIVEVEGTGAGVNTQLGSLFYITVDGDITEDAEVVDFSVPGFSEYPPVTVMTEIANNSEIHIRPTGDLEIKNMFGQVVARQEFTGGNIYPERNLVYENEFFSDSNIRVGRYTAELNAVFGQDNNIPITATASFVIFPWKIATASVLVVAIIIVVLLLLRKKKEDKEHEENNQTEETNTAQTQNNR